MVLGDRVRPEERKIFQKYLRNLKIFQKYFRNLKIFQKYFRNLKIFLTSGVSQLYIQLALQPVCLLGSEWSTLIGTDSSKYCALIG